MSSFYGRALAALALLCLAAPAYAAVLKDGGAVPHLDNAGREGYRVFLQQPGHRAFAIAPGGAWSWTAEQPTAEMAGEGALQACAGHGEQTCVLYALDDQVVFDAGGWPKLWGPYKTRAEAAGAVVGKRRGERFHDLALRTPAGKPIKLSDLRGKVVVLHFWGTWCPPCRNEMPELQKLNRELARTPDIQLVLLQMREDIGTARLWAESQRFVLPLYDSGVGDAGSDALPLANGRQIRDRELARVFPTTYVLDRHGVVVFSHTGPVSGWLQYLPFLRDVAARSGK
jgi:thiol-disulfide isomerase/thioredoxin